MGNHSCCSANDFIIITPRFNKEKQVENSRNENKNNNQNSSTVKAIIIIQKVWIGYNIRKKFEKYKMSSKGKQEDINTSVVSDKSIKKMNITPADDFDENLMPGELINIENIIIDPKVLETEEKLGDFVIDEKELILFIQKNKKRLKNYCLKYLDDSVYLGYFNCYWHREGYGVLIFKDGSKYQGFFHDNKMNGRGRLIGVNGDYYEGEFKDDKACEFGKYVNKDGGIYIGQWFNDKQNGIGDELFHDGSRYIGEYVMGNRNGKGKFIWPDGSNYEGEFSNNKIQGYGIYKWRNGKIFYGQWHDNKMNGIGLFLWPDKKKYLGEYIKDNKYGLGIFIWPDGRAYKGEWKKGKQHGVGVFKNSGTCQCGEWDKGKRIKWIEDNGSEINELYSKFNNEFYFKLPKLIIDLFDKIDINDKDNFEKLDNLNFFNIIEAKLNFIKVNSDSILSKSQSEEVKSEKNLKEEVYEEIQFKSFVKEIGKELNEFKPALNDIPYYNKTDFGEESPEIKKIEKRKHISKKSNKLK